mmetsp:Transcript_86123/g.252003  ORF Transcript_86123/g.252003 Transcript_86123/m.252003 type:complete len:244 (+) Transcript_86123:1664-2395(+)
MPDAPERHAGNLPGMVVHVDSGVAGAGLACPLVGVVQVSINGCSRNTHRHTSVLRLIDDVLVNTRVLGVEVHPGYFIGVLCELDVLENLSHCQNDCLPCRPSLYFCAITPQEHRQHLVKLVDVCIGGMPAFETRSLADLLAGLLQGVLVREGKNRTLHSRNKVVGAADVPHGGIEGLLDEEGGEEEIPAIFHVIELTWCHARLTGACTANRRTSDARVVDAPICIVGGTWGHAVRAVHVAIGS